METDSGARCARLLTGLIQVHGWDLSDEERATYVSTLAKHIRPHDSDEQVERSLENFHRDHEAVAALMDRRHRDHDDAWARWRRDTPRILHRVSQRLDAGHILDIDDLTQVALSEMSRKLASFRYASRLSTWAYKVIVRAAKHAIRDSLAIRRSAPQVPLDEQAGALLPAPAREQPDVVARGRDLQALMISILRQQHDDRLAVIFVMWACADRRLVEIGQHVGLGPARVSVLLEAARETLREHPAIRQWVSDDSSAGLPAASPAPDGPAPAAPASETMSA